MTDMILESVLDAFIDSAKLTPFLLVIYILLELFNRRATGNVYKLIKKNEKLGPMFGGVIGAIPQCGLSSAAATLYSGRVVTLGTMLAVFLSASDDMLPIFITEAVAPIRIVKIVITKMIIGIVTGYIIDLIMKLVIKKDNKPAMPTKMMSKRAVQKSQDIEICTQSCCTGPFWIAVLKHTFQVFIFIFAVSVILNVVIGLIGEDTIGRLFENVPIMGEIMAALIGLIPNCASSVVITELYLSGVMSVGALFAGLLVNAGVGILVLFKTNKNKKETITIVATLFVIGVIWGIIIELTGIGVYF